MEEFEDEDIDVELLQTELSKTDELEKKALKLYGSEENFKKAVELVENSQKGPFLEEIARLGIRPNSELWAMVMAYYNVSLLYKDVPKALSDFDSTVRALTAKMNLEMGDTLEDFLVQFKQELDERFENLARELNDEIDMVQEDKIMTIQKSKDDVTKSVHALAAALTKMNNDFDSFENRIKASVKYISEESAKQQQADVLKYVTANIKKEIPIVIRNTLKVQHNMWAIDRFLRDSAVVVLAGSILGILFKIFS